MSRLGQHAARPCRERSVVLAVLDACIVSPNTKLATTRWWHTTTLVNQFGGADAGEDDLYATMDWLLERQVAIESRLAAQLPRTRRHGRLRPLPRATRGHQLRARKLQVNCGLLSDARGCLAAVSVRESFGIEAFVIVGDRGMLSHKAIERL